MNRGGIHIEAAFMRTNIVIDDRLMKRAMRTAGTATKRETVERGLKLLVRLKDQENVRAVRGRLRWEGDLDAMRRDR
jgi:Arc/MetJ family transcription regulator